MGDQIVKTIIVKGQAPDLFRAWLNFGNHPQFMEKVIQVDRPGPDTNRWRMEGPAESELEWTTRTTREEPSKRIAWKTVEGDLKTSGQVTFTDLPQGETEITVTTQTVPPDDLVELEASAIFADEAAQLTRDLRNFKAMVEGRS